VLLESRPQACPAKVQHTVFPGITASRRSTMLDPKVMVLTALNISQDNKAY
jgi:hypothetical protein